MNLNFKINQYPYILQSSGETACSRLNVLHDVHHEASIQFIMNSVQNRAVKDVLEIGCGIGNMSFWFSDFFGPKCSIYAIDSSSSYIEISKKIREERKIQNIEFICKDLHNELNFDKKFDVIYSRYTLIHLRNINSVLHNLTQLLKPGGLLICEEPTVDSGFCNPFQKDYNKTRSLLKKLSLINKLDFKLGEKLKNLFIDELGLNIRNINFFQSILKNRHEKKLVDLMLEDCKFQYLTHGLLSESEFDSLLSKVKLFLSKSENYLIALSRTTQICGVKKDEKI